MTTNNDATGWYANVLKGWQAKLLGRKPTAGELDTIHKLGARPGKQALANAMALRECGVTGAQIVMACGAPQLNKMRGFIGDGVLKREPTPPSSEGHTVYKLKLTPKGETRVKQAAAAPKADTGKAKPVKAAAAKAANKPRKVKAVPASELATLLRPDNTGTLQPVTEPAPAPVEQPAR